MDLIEITFEHIRLVLWLPCRVYDSVVTRYAWQTFTPSHAYKKGQSMAVRLVRLLYQLSETHCRFVSLLHNKVMHQQ